MIFIEEIRKEDKESLWFFQNYVVDIQANIYDKMNIKFEEMQWAMMPDETVYYDFISYVGKKLNIKDYIVSYDIKIVFSSDGKQEILGEFIPLSKKVIIYPNSHRSYFDVLFTIAHELVHVKQYIEKGTIIFDIENHLSYSDRPTEKEANLLGGLYLSEYLDDTTNREDFVYNPHIPELYTEYLTNRAKNEASNCSP